MASNIDPSSSITQTITLRKRKRHNSLVINISSGCENDLTCTESEYDAGQVSDFGITSQVQVRKSGKNRCVCPFPGCAKAYAKPSRLAEHERVHTGDRPFVCSTCNKSYLRENHLQAHSRVHLPSTARPFACEEEGCGKRFWTSQHLRVHTELHRGEKPFKCTQAGCNATFSKNHQLRDHMCTAHSPPGTKPYRCEHLGCIKSFGTNQKLTAHVKTHNDKRYTCVHQSCLPAEGTVPTYYPTWSALQHHTRVSHPPTCPYPSCKGKIFTQQKGLRAHLKVHAQRDQEAGIDKAAAESGSEDGAERPQKRRRGGEIGRDWVCEVNGCGKDFRSKKALSTHHHIAHLGRRDFVCPHAHCKRAFGYKHLLRRHLAKLHAPAGSLSDRDSGNEGDFTDADAVCESPVVSAQDDGTGIDIDFLTGNAYAVRAREFLKEAHKLQCPHPHMPLLLSSEADESGPSVVGSGSKRTNDCQYVYSRAYDLRRHLQAEHSINVEREKVDQWVREVKVAKSLA